MLYPMLYTSIIIFFIITSVCFFFANTITVPIVELTKKARRMANGSLKQKIIIKSHDEIGELATSLNYMAQKLNYTLQKLLHENTKFEVILENISDGILYYNTNGELAQYNNAVCNLLGFDVYKVNLNDLIKKLNLEADTILNTSVTFEKVINFNDKYINCSFISCSKEKKSHQRLTNTSTMPYAILIFLHDVTKQQKLDNMRKEFVANVSHEIRTPLTIIKSYTETLLEHSLNSNNNHDMQIKFLEIINKETDRITLLTKDLLELSCFDNNQMRLEFKNTNLSDIIVKSIDQNIMFARKKHQTIHFDFSDKQKKIFIKCDANKITQVFSNVISNAIKYSDNNSLIRIYLRESNDSYEVFIKDNGCGIAENDLQNIFERFYRTDKARSRTIGGNGLGLSIARAIMQSHNGKIDVRSRLNTGTTVVISFKKT
jgi:two-component system sensor histidine kinase VicK